MKNTFLICLFALFAFSGCADDEEDFSTGGNISPELTPENKENAVLNAAVFEKINLDYPGLEKVKQYYEAGENYLAANALLDYYRTRTNVVNPALSLLNITLNTGNKDNNYSDGDQNIANFALEYRFFVKGFYEGSDKKPYSLGKAGSIDWNKNANVGEEYLKQLHRHQWFIPQAKVYRVSREEKYINSWIEIYSDWIAQNPQPAEGPNTTSWWQLQVANRIIDQVQLLEYFKYSDNFTPEWLTTFLASFAEQADFLVKYPYDESGNILVTQGQALVTAGVLMPELKNASIWMNAGYDIVNAEVENQFLPDGWHKEMSLHYHISAVADFYETMRLTQANKLTNKLNPNFSESLRKAAEAVMHFTYPNYFTTGSDYIVPAFNDSWKSNWTRSTISKNFIRYVELFPDSEEFKYMATAANGGSSQGKTPGNEMKIFEDAGYYVMRNGWEPSSTVMIFSNNKSNDISKDLERWSHNQADNGTFELYINKRNFFPDSGVYTYNYNLGSQAGKDRLWFRNSENHNTLTFGKVTDGSRQASDFTKAEGRLLKADNDVLVFENQGYDNLKHRRAVFYVNKSFFVLVDEGIGNATGDVHLNFNLCDKTEDATLDADAKGAHTNFTNNNIIVRTFAETGKTISCTSKTGRISYTSSESTPYQERTAYSIDMNKGTNETARFITVILPVDQYTGAENISASFGNCTDNSISVDVTVKGETKTLSYTL